MFSLNLKMVCYSAEPFSKSIIITLQAISLLSIKMKILSSKDTLVDPMGVVTGKNGQSNRLVPIFEAGAPVWEILDPPLSYTS